ncbi:hypothetical protein [Streptomyces sp. NPDC001315]|uniref:hypothetical protein n=1 Tax=Streptomyces sp. NPDC001315 TaxID=3364562 RepID=UPI0036B6E4A0
MQCACRTRAGRPRHHGFVVRRSWTRPRARARSPRSTPADQGVHRADRTGGAGAPPGTADIEQDRIRDWSGAPGPEAVFRACSREPRRLDGDMARARPVIVPLRREGFGLVGVEAVIRGVPLPMSANSGPAVLLPEALEGETAPLIVQSRGTTKSMRTPQPPASSSVSTTARQRSPGWRSMCPTSGAAPRGGRAG